MKLINLNELVLVGPGSEWFWTAISGLILAATFLAIYRQLRLQRDANAFEQLNAQSRDWEAERLLRVRLEVLRAYKIGARLPPGSVTVITDFWEGVGTLARGGHVDLDLTYENFGLSCRFWWAVTGGLIATWRDTHGTVEIGRHFEWLATTFAEIARKREPAANVSDPALVASALDSSIEALEDMVRVAMELRMIPTRRALSGASQV